MFIDNKFVIRYFYFEEKHATQEQIRLTTNIFRAVESHTCLKFLKTTQETAGYDLTSIRVAVIDMGCAAYLGRFSKGWSNIALGDCDEEYKALHELLHIMGFIHEQARPDRDRFVNIHWDNIIPRAYPQFAK
ncbi:Astacin-like metalloprotease toxin, partial [Leptotrombidium deliense]